jgi:hypothetical protein
MLIFWSFWFLGHVYFSVMLNPMCHVERSETSREFRFRVLTPEILRFTQDDNQLSSSRAKRGDPLVFD